jgi:hypothetical protein
MLLPPRIPGSASGSALPGTQLETTKARILARLDDRLGLSASKRMPPSLLQQTLRSLTEQLLEQEHRGLARADRDRLVEEVIAEFLGYGPLEELFKDPSVREVLVAGSQAVIVRRHSSPWMPTSIKFRNEEHLLMALERMATFAEPVGPATSSTNFYDLKLFNGFRAVCVIAPEALEHPASAAFIRCELATPEPPTPQTPPPSWDRVGSSNSSPTAPGEAKSSSVANDSSARAGLHNTTVTHDRDPLLRHRNRIIERLTSTLARLGVYDLQQLEVTELRKAVAAYIDEYCLQERIYLSDSDRGRLLLEIMAAIER